MPAHVVRSHGTTTTCICGRRESEGVLKEIRFSYRHEGCWLQEATEAHPDLLLVVSSVYSANDHVVMTLTVHASDPETLPVVEAAWEESTPCSVCMMARGACASTSPTRRPTPSSTT